MRNLLWRADPLEGAFNQLQTYKDQIPSLFRTNGNLLHSEVPLG